MFKLKQKSYFAEFKIVIFSILILGYLRMIVLNFNQTEYQNWFFMLNLHTIKSLDQTF